MLRLEIKELLQSCDDSVLPIFEMTSILPKPYKVGVIVNFLSRLYFLIKSFMFLFRMLFSGMLGNAPLKYLSKISTAILNSGT